MHFNLKFTFIALILGVLSLSEAALYAATVRRAGFDLGSGSFKLRIADVDPQKQEVVQWIDLSKDLSQKKVSAADDLNANQGKSLSKTYEAAALMAATELYDLAKKQGASEFIGVATGAFRKASNGADVIKSISSTLKFPIEVIDARTEALVAFRAARAISKIPVQDILCWDVGGSSQQFAYEDKSGFKFFSSDLASVAFKKAVVQNVLKQDSEKIFSPNPMSQKTVDQAVVYLRKQLRSFPAEIRALMQSKKPRRVIGVGGVHNVSIFNQLAEKSKFYLVKDLKAAIDLSVKQKWDDVTIREKTGSKYPETDKTNLILIYGAMLELGIEKIELVDANLADGLVLGPVR